MSGKMAMIPAARLAKEWDCAARKQGSAGGNDPADCNWPFCGCDPYADKVLAAIQESGFTLTRVVDDTLEAK